MTDRPDKPLLLIKTGGTIPETRDEHGDFEEWFARGLGAPGLHLANVFKGEVPPAEPAAYAAVIVTGSASMVSHREDWSERTAEWLASAVHLGLPVLGVCFGHQLLAHALGGVVGPNPRGRQIGTQVIETTPEAASDPLMCRMPTSMTVQTTHVENVHELPAGAVRLATSPRDHNHAFRFGQRAWGVQFHPEFGADVMRGYIRARAQIIRDEGFDPEAIAASVVETPVAHSLLGRFAALAGGIGETDACLHVSAPESLPGVAA
ncbi:MAG: glutamine amidotransferase [Xanthomonadales bacterium]|nr:glutamine amidotransferase [Xanthomonadales bacterium]